MSQFLEGVDIYHCEYFEVDSRGKIKLVKGAYVNRTPDSFKTINEIYNIMRYCMWIIKQKNHPEITKYAAVVYMNRVNERLKRIESEYRKILKTNQAKKEKNLKNSIDKPGRTYV
jgi:hypothetical protein